MGMTMKILFSAAVFFVCLVTQAATPSFNSFDLTQFQTNGLVIRVKPSGLFTNPIIASGQITGDGGGLTNLAVLTTVNVFINNVTNNNLSVTNIANINILNVTNLATFKGNAVFQSNAYFLNLNFSTNEVASLAIVAGNTAQSMNTNNNVTFTGYSGINGTNAQPFTLVITNNSVGAKFYQFPAGTLMLSSPFTNGVYNTNQGVFSGWIYPGKGTNATWAGF